MGAGGVLLSLLLVIAAVGTAGAEDAMIRPAAVSVVGEVVDIVQVQAGGTLCCSNMTGFQECVHDCLCLLPPEQKKYCDGGCKEAYQCQTVSGDECPSPSGRRSSSPDDCSASAAKGNAVDHCILGYNSTVCNKMITAAAGVVGRKGVVKHAIQRCNNACYKLCTNGVRAGISTASYGGRQG